MLKFLTNVQSSASVRLSLWLGGKQVGSDVFGNVYYTKPPKRGLKRERRFVLYANGGRDASMVPAEWHGWLHHQTNLAPTSVNPLRREWQKPHQPNMTGTNAAYIPPGHVQRGATRDAATGDYEAWTPQE
jgi:NADH:ubiquinone oxidoreductase subunit